MCVSVVSVLIQIIDQIHKAATLVRAIKPAKLAGKTASNPPAATLTSFFSSTSALPPLPLLLPNCCGY